MDKNRTWSRLGFAIGMLVVIIAFAGWLVIGNYERWLPGHSQTELRPATIKMVVLRIDSNIMRIQSIMENLVYSEYPKALSDKVRSVNQLAADIDDDFKAMGEQFNSNNIQYQKALTLFKEWKPIRD